MKSTTSRELISKVLGKKNPPKEKTMRELEPKQSLPVPYLSKLSDGGGSIKPGQSMRIRGVFSGPEGLCLNLASENQLEATEPDKVDVVLRVVAKIAEKKIVLTSCSEGKWSKEQKHKCALSESHEFDLRIRAEDEYFQVFANSIELGKFEYRLSLESIRFIYITGDFNLHHVGWEGKYYINPYQTSIPGNFHPGRKLFVSGHYERKSKNKNNEAKGFTINLYVAKQIAFHFNPRFDKQCIVRNSKLEDVWGSEEKDGDFPFIKNHSFDIVIVAQLDAFECYVDDVLVCRFNHRISVRKVDKLGIEGDIELLAVTLK